MFTFPISFMSGAQDEASTDPDFANVSLLLHYEGANNSTTFTDSSSNGFTGSATNAIISTAQAKFGDSSGSFNGTNSYTVFGANSAFNPGTGLFTVETFARFNSVSVTQTIITTYNGSTTGWSVYMDGASIKLNLTGDVADINGSTVIVPNTWYHIAWTKSASNIRLFVDGVLNGSVTDSNDLTGGDLYLGVLNVPGFGFFDYLNGYLDETRITKGVARYTADFTPPTAPFPNS